MNSCPRWANWLPWIALAAFAVLWIARWAGFPLVLDPYYHLFIAEQIVAAGGPLAYEWWEYAPIGRPHLYPPVLHLVLATLLKFGCSPITAIRLVSVVAPPLLLTSLFLVMRRLTTAPVALSCVGIGLLPFAFHLHCAITLAATIGMVILLWLMVALEQDRSLAAGVLIALLCYTHLGLPWIALLTMICAVLLRPAMWRSAVKAGWGWTLAIPWWMHLLKHRSIFHIFPRLENTMIEIMPLLYVAAAIGFWRCWRMRGGFVWTISSWIGFAVLARHYPYRWLSGEGMLPIILLAGVGLEWIVSHANSRYRMTWLPGLVLFLGLVASPTIEKTPTGWHWIWLDSAPWHLTGAPWVKPKEVDASFYSPFIERLAEVVNTQSRPGEIVWSNAPYAIGLVAALAHRPISSAMLNEVAPTSRPNPIHVAHLIVWFKFEHIPGTPTLAQLSGYRLTRVAEDDVAVVFRQADVSRLAHPPQAACSFSLAIGLLSTALALIIWDLRRPRHAI